MMAMENEVMSLDTRHRDDGGNYIADDDTSPRCVWFANGRKVAIEYTEVKSEIKGGEAYLTVERELHPAFGAMQPDIRDHKYLNAECGLNGCQWLMAQHQVDVYRKQMAKAEADCEANKNAATYWWTRYYKSNGYERPKAFDSATEDFAASHEALLKERDELKALNDDKFRHLEAYRKEAAHDKAKLKILLAAGQTLLTVSLPPNDVSGSEMFENAAAKFREEF
jgi:hypothetical protein